MTGLPNNGAEAEPFEAMTFYYCHRVNPPGFSHTVTVRHTQHPTCWGAETRPVKDQDIDAMVTAAVASALLKRPPPE